MYGYLIRSCVAIWLALIVNSAIAAIDVHTFSNEVERLRYQSFIDELRCPKCQNQNLSGSDSPIASDLRNELYSMIKAGRSDTEIVDFMVSRYGEFILYKPRLTLSTLFLWSLPIVLLLTGGGVLALMVRRRRHQLAAGDDNLSQAEQVRLNKLLGVMPNNDNKV